MKPMHFSISINAPVEKVWHTMLEQDTYRIWAAEFMPGSCYEGSWEQGSKILFLDPNRSGMSSMIAENRPYQFISIKHLGVIREGVEDAESEESKAWASVSENYTFKSQGGGTLLLVEMSGIPAEFETFMAEAWPKALAKLKTLCE
ncbi:MAG: SRPBCC domain-containing protein [Gallionellaceae bacterium]|nr:SRPBCC domain-containing protein [Gallionellaceae bacterium]